MTNHRKPEDFGLPAGTRATKKKKECLLGPLSPSKSARHYVPPPLNLPPPTIHCNASMKERLQLKPSAPARAGADDFRKFGSVGMGC